MGRAKLKRINGLEERLNVLQEGHSLYDSIKSNWRKGCFKNENPIILELACGKGHYTTGLAKIYANKNFVGIDVKGDRLWVGSTNALEDGLKNAAFLRAQIQHINHFFDTDEVDEIWITFPDPRPKDRDIKRRLTAPRFLNLYKDLLKKRGLIHLKTDNLPLFNYTIEVLEERNDVKILESTYDLYQSTLITAHHGIQTEFEKKFLQNEIPIKYMVFQFVD